MELIDQQNSLALPPRCPSPMSLPDVPPRCPSSMSLLDVEVGERLSPADCTGKLSESLRPQKNVDQIAEERQSDNPAKKVFEGHLNHRLYTGSFHIPTLCSLTLVSQRAVQRFPC